MPTIRAITVNIDPSGEFRMPTLQCIAGLTACLLLATAPCAGAAETDRVDAFVRAEMERQKVPGVAVAVIQKGHVAKVAGYGLANVELNVPVGPTTVFQSGSLGKQFTAVAVMLQVEDGKLALDDSIAKFFPGAPSTWQPITVRHLLTHTSGIPDYEGGVLDLQRNYTEDELATFAFGLKPEFSAGARWNYSNTGYVLLGIIVHKVSGRFYGDVLRDRVFTPLGMRTARIISEEDIVPNRAAGYRLVNGELKNQEWVAPLLNTTADGSLYLTALDFVAWDKGIRERAILKPESWAQIFQPVRLNSGNAYPYGFGWAIDDYRGQVRQHHSGEWQGFCTYISRYLNDDLTIVVLDNLAGSKPGRIVDGIAATYNPSLGPAELHPIEDPEPQTAARLAAILREVAGGELDRSDFSYVPAGFFPEAAAQYREMLRNESPVTRTELLERRQVGDDWAYVYRASFGPKVFTVRFALASDGKLTSLSLSPEPNQ